jgi:hypothetical protein
LAHRISIGSYADGPDRSDNPCEMTGEWASPKSADSSRTTGSRGAGQGSSFALVRREYKAEIHTEYEHLDRAREGTRCCAEESCTNR